MRKTTIAGILAAIAVVGFSTAAFAKHQKSHPQRPRFQPSWQDCYQLAMRRGYNMSSGDRRITMDFVDACLAGRVPF